MGFKVSGVPRSVSELQTVKPFLAVILMTSKPTTRTTIEAMKLGATTRADRSFATVGGKKNFF
jgi:DNA-binding NtrC family response regulator